MFYAHCQAPANSYDTLFLLRHTPHFRAGFSSASSRQAKHDRNSRTVGTPHYPRPFCIQSRHANSHRRHYSCMEEKSKYIPHGKRRIEGVRHEWRFLRLHIDLFRELRRYLRASLCQDVRGIFHGNSKHPFGPLRFAAGYLLCSDIQRQKICVRLR